GWTDIVSLVTLASHIKTGSFAVKQSNALLKLAVVASSVLLLSGFVSYRAGAFNWLLQTSTPQAHSGSSPSVEPTPSQPRAPASAEPAPIMMSSSKSALVVPPSTTGVRPPATSKQPASDATAPRPAILPGSKSAPIFVPPQGAQPPNPPSSRRAASKTGD